MDPLEARRHVGERGEAVGLHVEVLQAREVVLGGADEDHNQQGADRDVVQQPLLLRAGSGDHPRAEPRLAWARGGRSLNHGTVGSITAWAVETKPPSCESISRMMSSM